MLLAAKQAIANHPPFGDTQLEGPKGGDDLGQIAPPFDPPQFKQRPENCIYIYPKGGVISELTAPKGGAILARSTPLWEHNIRWSKGGVIDSVKKFTRPVPTSLEVLVPRGEVQAGQNQAGAQKRKEQAREGKGNRRAGESPPFRLTPVHIYRLQRELISELSAPKKR